MELQKHSCRRIAALIFPATLLVTNYVLHAMNYTERLALGAALFTAVMTTGIWLEVSYRFLIKEATAPVDRLLQKLTK